MMKRVNGVVHFLTVVPFHPWLLGLLLVLIIGQGDQYSLQEEYFRPMIATTVATSLCFFLLSRIVRDKQKAAIIVSTGIFWFFMYPFFSTLANYFFHHPPFWFHCLVLAVLIWSISKGIENKELRALTACLNIAILVLLSINVSIEAIKYTKVAMTTIDVVGKAHASPIPSIPSSVLKRDIYYIVLDGMASPSVLNSHYNYDNEQYCAYLRGKGFLLPRANANYPITVLSLGATTNLEYLDFWQRGKSYQIPVRLLNNNKLVHYLKLNGYKIVNVASGFTPTEDLAEADFNLRGNVLTGFEWLLCKATAVNGFLKDWLDADLRQNRIYPFKAIKEIKKMPGPKFVFIHVLLPHPPFVFSAEGKETPATTAPGSCKWESEGYLSQAKFAEVQTRSTVESLLTSDGSPEPIIVIHSDHGPHSDDRVGKVDYTDVRKQIFAAIYLPGGAHTELPEPSSPVNFFRYVLSNSLGVHLPLLPNEDHFDSVGPLRDSVATAGQK